MMRSWRVWPLRPSMRRMERASGLRSAVRKCWRTMRRAGTDYHFEFLRRNKNGGTFWGSTGFRSCLQPETRDIIVFFIQKRDGEAKIQEQLRTRSPHWIMTALLKLICFAAVTVRLSSRRGRITGHACRGCTPVFMREAADYCVDEAARMESIWKSLILIYEGTPGETGVL